MTEIYLSVLDRVLTPILLMIAVLLLLVGHNAPGGGFIAGLVAASAFELQILSRGPGPVRVAVGRFLQPAIGLGLLVAVSSAAIGMLFYDGFFQGVWWEIEIGAFHYDLGTPFLFDIGVFLTVVGFATSYLLGLSDAIESEEQV